MVCRNRAPARTASYSRGAYLKTAPSYEGYSLVELLK